MMSWIGIVGRIRSLRTLGAGLGVLLLLSACQAYGGGSLGGPLDDTVSVFQGDATFGFALTCEVRKGRAVVQGNLTYYDRGPTLPFGEVAIHGVLDPIVVNVPECQAVPDALMTAELQGFPAALFEGKYRALNSRTGNKYTGRFSVLVFDQGEPARPGGDFTGDGFSIELFGPPYGGYTRGGYLDAGNIQVNN